MLADRLSFLFSYIQLQVTVWIIGPKYNDALLPKACFILTNSLPTINWTILSLLYSSSVAVSSIGTSLVTNLSVVATLSSQLFFHHNFFSVATSLLCLATRFFIFLSKILAKLCLTFPRTNNLPTWISPTREIHLGLERLFKKHRGMVLH